MRRGLLRKMGEILPPEPNVFIGKCGLYYDQQRIADSLNVQFSDLKSYHSDANGNISFNINTTFVIGFNAFRNLSGFLPANGITYFIDVDNNCIEILGSAFQQQASFNFLLTKKITLNSATANQTNITNIKNYGYFDNIQRINTGTLSGFRESNRLYIPLVTNVTSFIAAIVKVNGTIYANPFLATSNEGALDACLQWNIDNRNATIVFVTDTTAPNRITDLSVSNITSNSAVLNFTPPNSINGISYYNVWLDDNSNNPVRLYIPFQEISSSGSVITGLLSATNYKVKIKAYTTMGTEAEEFSNTIEFTTL